MISDKFLNMLQFYKPKYIHLKMMKNISNWINVDKGIKVKTKEDCDQNLNFHAFRSPKQSKIAHCQNKSIFINLQSACIFEAVMPDLFVSKMMQPEEDC